MRTGRPLSLALLALALAASPAAASARAGSGSAGVGDRLLPNAGNGGYDVATTTVRLRYDPRTHAIAAFARVRATATMGLARFDLDLRGMHVVRVTVGGRRAGFRREGQELVIAPAVPIASGAAFAVDVAYGGRPAAVTDADGSPDGWQETDDGVFTASEPQGAPTWFPANDTPRDKMTLTVIATVPSSLVAVGNGHLARRAFRVGARSTTWTTYTWQELDPIAPYLATLDIGHFAITRGTAGGVPSYVAVDPRERALAQPVLARIDRILRWEASVFGPYPFADTGAIVDHAPFVGYALETQTRPLFDRAPDETTLVHELAHQWFGDSVSLESWQDIWLNEGFATFAEWLWAEHVGGSSTSEAATAVVNAHRASDAFWCVPPNALADASQLFAEPVYERGAVALARLRTRIGDAAFFTVLRRWAAEHAHGTGTSAQLEALAAEVSHSGLGGFFRVWLRAPGKPGAPSSSCGSRHRAGAAAAATPRRR